VEVGMELGGSGLKNHATEFWVEIFEVTLAYNALESLVTK
jgi:hypothetical protein